MNNAPPPPPSDPIYKRLYAFVRMVEDPLRSLFGADLDADYRTLEKLPAEYVGEALQQRRGDTAWRLRTAALAAPRPPCPPPWRSPPARPRAQPSRQHSPPDRPWPSADAPETPTAQCNGTPCFRGFETTPGSPLILFHRPPQPLAAPAPEPLAAGDPLRLPLASLVAPGDAPDGMAWEASSSDASIATARIVGAALLLQPEPASEGTARITLVATDALGLRATVRFEVQVEFHWPHGPSRGWRSTLGNTVPDARQ